MTNETESVDLQAENAELRRRLVVAEIAIDCAAQIFAHMAEKPVGLREVHVPQVNWIKESPGQTTNGRIGKPVLREGPVSWLPKILGDAILRAVKESGR